MEGEQQIRTSRSTERSQQTSPIIRAVEFLHFYTVFLLLCILEKGIRIIVAAVSSKRVAVCIRLIDCPYDIPSLYVFFFVGAVSLSCERSSSRAVTEPAHLQSFVALLLCTLIF